MPSKDHKQLLRTLNKYVKQERWQKLPKKKGEVTAVGMTKSGNAKISMENLAFFVLKRNKNLFAEAQKIRIGEIVSVALRTQLGRYYCVKLSRSKDMVLSKWG